LRRSQSPAQKPLLQVPIPFDVHREGKAQRLVITRAILMTLRKQLCRIVRTLPFSIATAMSPASFSPPSSCAFSA
jgi:hypothetical protein